MVFTPLKVNLKKYKKIFILQIQHITSTYFQVFSGFFQQASMLYFCGFKQVIHIAHINCIQYYPHLPVDNIIFQIPVFPTVTKILLFVNTHLSTIYLIIISLGNYWLSISKFLSLFRKLKVFLPLNHSHILPTY